MYWAETAMILVVALAGGVIASGIKLPPLVGFLAAGFLLHAFGVQAPPNLDTVANLGVTLLLFTIGLQFDARVLLRKDVWAATGTHMLVGTLMGTGLMGLLATVGVTMVGDNWRPWAVLGFALTFSSTVLCVKVLEERNDDGTLYGQVAIAILLMQDVAAVLFMEFAAGKWPSMWAFALVALLPGTWLIHRILDHVGHDELLVLFGVVLALVPGWAAFEAVGLKGDLGALILGLLVASHSSSNDLARTLFGLKELLLIGFFVSIGFHGTPTWTTLLVAVVICLVLLPPKTAAYAWVIRANKVRNRTAILASMSLGHFSEFALILIALVVEQGVLSNDALVTVAIAVALSMAIASIVNRNRNLVDKFCILLPSQEPEKLDPRDRPIDLTGADAIVLGMGRIGTAAYQHLVESGMPTLGIEHISARVEKLRSKGYNVIEGDATDTEFWIRVASVKSVRLLVFAMPFHHSNVTALQLVRAFGVSCAKSAINFYPEEAEELIQLGVEPVNLFDGSGHALAEAALSQLVGPESEGTVSAP